MAFIGLEKCKKTKKGYFAKIPDEVAERMNLEGKGGVEVYADYEKGLAIYKTILRC